jgi:hypothetical protein
MIAHDPPTAEHPWADLAPAHALGALDADERAAFTAHLGSCARCQAEVAEFTELTAALASVVPAAAALRRRCAPACSPRPRPRPSARSRARSCARSCASRAARRGTCRIAWGGAVDVRSLDAARARAAGRPATARPTTARIPWLAAAAAALLAVGLGAQWRGERGARADVERQLAERIAASDAQVTAQATALAERDSLLAALLAPDLQTARLTATGIAPDVRVRWQRSRGVVILTAAALPERRPAAPTSCGGSRPAARRRAWAPSHPRPAGAPAWVLRVPPNTTFALAAITDEPAGGSPAPTTTPIVAGSFGAE